MGDCTTRTCGRVATTIQLYKNTLQRVALVIAKNVDAMGDMRGLDITYYESTSRKALTDLPICGYAARCRNDGPVHPDVRRCGEF